MLLGGIIGVVYYTRVVSFLFYHPYKGEAGVREAPVPMLAAMGVLAAAISSRRLRAGLSVEPHRPGWRSFGGAQRAQSLPLPGLMADWPLGAG